VTNLVSTKKQATLALGIFTALVLLITGVSVMVGSPDVNVGSPRPLDTIPIHLLELAGFGIILGIPILGVYGRSGVGLALLMPAMVVLLDLDHLPVFLGIAQPIRPAHSLVFLVTDMMATTIILRRLDFNLIIMSAFVGHIGVDTGLLPPLGPFSFQYVQLDQYRLLLVVSSITLAILAGYVWRRESGSTRLG
jgi:hypothetical protein